MKRSRTRVSDAKTLQNNEWVSPPAYVTIAKTDRPEQPWDVCGLFENVYDASDATGPLYGVTSLVCRLVPISRDGNGETRICPLCGDSFDPLRRNQVYCNPDCRTEAQVARKKPGHRRGRQNRGRR